MVNWIISLLNSLISLVLPPISKAILAAWSSIFTPLGERILAVADSNVAADNIYVPQNAA